MGSKETSPKPNDYYILTPDEEKAIAEKAEELYQKRIAPYAPDLASPARETIIDFQKLVFVADHYFEHNENLNPAVLASFWAQFEKLFDDLEMPKDLQVTLLQDIKDYADIEASIRIGKKLAEYEIRFFYFKKSCDVRMQRHIIRFLNKQTVSSSDSEISRDILEEIEDDIDDIEEDKLTPFGGNRFLEILNSKNVEKFSEYVTFINSLPNSPQDLVQRILDKTSKFMESIKPRIESDPSLELATSIAQNIDTLLGTHEYYGDHPYEIQMLDTRDNKGYIYQLRRDDDWIAIQERVSDNPSLIRTFFLKKKNEGWIYDDPYLQKYGESSFDMLQTTYERLKIAIEAFAPGKLGKSKKELPEPSPENSD